MRPGHFRIIRTSCWSTFLFVAFGRRCWRLVRLFRFPDTFECDEYTALARAQVAGKIGVNTLYVEPGSPWESVDNEYFSGNSRDRLPYGESFHWPRPGI
jgi:hypothetical protein